MLLSGTLNIVVVLPSVAELGICCYHLDCCHERLDEIRARIARNKKSTEEAYRMIEETCEDERQ